MHAHTHARTHTHTHTHTHKQTNCLSTFLKKATTFLVRLWIEAQYVKWWHLVTVYNIQLGIIYAWCKCSICWTCLAWSWSEKVMVTASPLPVLFNWLSTVFWAILWPHSQPLFYQKWALETLHNLCVFRGMHGKLGILANWTGFGQLTAEAKLFPEWKESSPD